MHPAAGITLKVAELRLGFLVKKERRAHRGSGDEKPLIISHRVVHNSCQDIIRKKSVKQKERSLVKKTGYHKIMQFTTNCQ